MTTEMLSPIRQRHQDPKDYVNAVLTMLCPNGKSNLEGSARAEMVVFRDAVGFYCLENAEGEVRDANGDLVGFHVDQDKLPWLAEQAKEDPAAFEALTNLASLYERSVYMHPKVISSHILSYLDGTVRKPIRKRSKYGRRDRLIAVLVGSVASEYDLCPTRNDATNERNSACDLVTRALNKFGFVEVTYATVKRAYFEHR